VTNLTYWIPTEFGSTYNIQIWVDSPGVANPTATGTQVFADGSGGTGQWFYNYQSGVLNFIGETIPASLTAGKVIYVVGYRYIGLVGVTDLPSGTKIGNLTITGSNIVSDEANANINISSNGTGVIVSNANVYAPTFIGNVVGNISGNITIGGSNTQLIFNDNGLANGNANLTFNKANSLLTLSGILSVSGNTSIGGNLNMSSQWINNVGYPNLSTDAASKSYVDTMVSTGIAYHQPVNVATTTTLATATGGTITYNNGASGVSANLVTTGTFLLIDSANVQTVGTRILVKDEANAVFNGVYTYANTTTIVRATDADEYGPDSTTQLSINDYFFTLGGVVNEGTAFVVASPPGEITFGTSNITFSVFSQSQVYDAGTGIDITGTTISTTANQSHVTAVGTLTDLSVAGNANIGNIGTGGFITATGNITGANILTAGIVSATGNGTFGNVATAGNITTSNATINLELSGNTANFTGNVYASNFIGNISGNIVIPGANTGVVYNDAGNANSSTAFTFDNSSNAVTATGNITAANLVTGGVVTATGNITGANILTGGIISATGNIIGGNLSITGISSLSNIVGANITTASNANLNIEPNGNGLVVIANTAGGATAIAMGDPTQGNLVSNAVVLSNSSSVSNAIAQLNLVLGKLVPASPPNFPASQSITIQSLSSYRMANYVQTDNTPGANKSVAGGTTVTSVRRASSYSTGNITVAGPGDSGTITAQLNGANAGSRTLTANLDGNGTYSNLVIFNNYDYSVANANITAGFWSVFSTRVAGTITEGWNEVYISDSAASNTNTANWFYDSSAPGTPAFSALGITPPGAPSYVYSSTVAHYDNTNVFNVTFDVNKLSGNMYPTSDTFVTGTSGGAFGAPTSITYSTAGISTPLAQNLYVASGNASVATTSTIIAGFGASSTGPSVSVFNSYNTGTQAFTTTLAANTLYKTGTTSSATRIEEANVFVGSTIGSGSGLAFRIDNPGSGNTPVYTANAAAFNSQSSTLQTYDSTIVANILKHDQTNYATGYLPAGPNLSVGRSGTQYFTFKIVRTSVSKFDVKWSGNVAGIWVALPGSTIDTTSSANGWLSMSTAYAGAGIPGVNAPGNGSDGCALGGVAPLNSVQTNKSVTATFGTVSSSSTATNEIYVRIALTSGQTVTGLSFKAASN
jgi:hypothetical protein